MRALLKEGAEDGDGNEGDATSGQESGADSGDESPSKKARIEMLRDMEKRRKEAARKLSGKSSSEDGEVNKGYMDASFVLGTSVIVERFFSQCKLVLSDRRASLTPWMFECIMFLKVNKDYWGIEDTAIAIKRCEGQQVDAREQRDFNEHPEAALNPEM